MNNPSHVIDAYLAMWSETDAGRRAELIATAWMPSGRYVDPLFDAEGHDALDTMVVTAQDRFPDHTLRLASALDAHHDEVRFAWVVDAPDGSVALAGTDFASFSADGRLTSVVGFFGDLPTESAVS
jgi:hypothetical protein